MVLVSQRRMSIVKCPRGHQGGWGLMVGAADSSDLCRQYKGLVFIQREIKSHGKALSGGGTGSVFYFNEIILATGLKID